MQALQEITSNGTRSLFTQLMVNRSVDAVAAAADLRPFPGDSFSDQVLGYTAASSTKAKPPVGLHAGLATGGVFLLAVTATLGVYIHRQRKQNRQQQVRTCWGIVHLFVAVHCIWCTHHYSLYSMARTDCPGRA